MEQIPDKTVKIQTSNGSILVFQMSEVERITKEAKSGNAPAFGGRIGIQTAGGVTFMVRYLATKPKYEVNVSGPGTSTTSETEQKQAVVLFTLGIGS